MENKTHGIRDDSSDKKVEEKCIGEMNLKIIIEMNQDILPQDLHTEKYGRESYIVPEMFPS
jgi:hypothetical protein